MVKIICALIVIFMFFPSFAASAQTTPASASQCDTAWSTYMTTVYTYKMNAVDNKSYCPAGQINDQYFQTCADNYYKKTADPSFALYCNVVVNGEQRGVFNKRTLFDPFFTQLVKGYIASVGSADPNKALTPRPTSNPSIEFGEETVDSIVNKTKETCGGVGEKCCLPLGDAPAISVSSIFNGTSFDVGGIVSGFMDKLISLMNPLTGGAITQMNQIILNDSICPQTTGSAEIIYKSNPGKINKVPSSTLNAEVENVNDIQSCSCVGNELGQGSLSQIRYLCLNIPEGKERDDCNSCSEYGIWTGIGCIDYDIEPFVQNFIFKYGIGLAGIFSLLCIGYASFTMQTSVNNPEKIKHAQDLMTSCITGLLLVIFSVFILRVIGVDILQIPGLGG